MSVSVVECDEGICGTAVVSVPWRNSSLELACTIQRSHFNSSSRAASVKITTEFCHNTPFWPGDLPFPVTSVKGEDFYSLGRLFLETLWRFLLSITPKWGGIIRFLCWSESKCWSKHPHQCQFIKAKIYWDFGFEYAGNNCDKFQHPCNAIKCFM